MMYINIVILYYCVGMYSFRKLRFANSNPTEVDEFLIFHYCIGSVISGILKNIKLHSTFSLGETPKFEI